ncbi:sigma-54 interaction domain-containing protein [Eubacterium ramulus]
MKLSRLLLDALETFPNFVIIDKNATIVYLNESYASLLGIPREQAIGQPVTDVIPKTRMVEVLKSGKPDIGHLMTLYDHSQKKNVTVACNRMPIFQNGQVIGAAAVTIMQDVLPTVTQLNRELSAVRKENEFYRHELNMLQNHFDSLNRIIGHSPALLEIKQTISDYAASDLPILITGETGVGKELFAKAIHEMSPRKFHPYIKINCAAIPTELLESELFGYEPGAFSGASKNGKPGKFELANHGTILLDEIGEMPQTLQSKLLRVLQEQEFERIGGINTIKIDVRIICCTNQNLQQLIQVKRFRSDLYYRINTVELKIPPLRNRKKDIAELTDYFIQKYNAEHDTHVISIDTDVLQLFQSYDWPGNVRELEHIVERLCTINNNRTITMKSCGFLQELVQQTIHTNPDSSATALTPSDLQTPLSAAPGISAAQPKAPVSASSQTSELSWNDLSRKIQNTEKEAIIQALLQTNGNKAKAARLLNIDRSSLYYKLKKYNITE